MARPVHSNGLAADARVDWVDYAKGFCIVFVVMMHSTLGVGNAVGQEGWLHTVVAFAKPFRMPDFFLISGLFLARVIDRDWRTYLDRKVLHFVYFYLLWTAIQFAVKAPLFVHEHGVLGMAWLYLRDVLGAVRHALVHLSAADLLRRRQAGAQPARPVGRDLDCGRRARDRAHPHRLDRDRRVRQPLRLLLHRLSAGPAHLRAGEQGAGAPGDGAGRPHDLGLRQRAAGVQRPGRTRRRLAGARACGRSGGGGGLGADGQERRVQAAALLRAQFDRHLPRLLPADGALAHGAAQDRLDHRRRHDLGPRHARRRDRRARLVLGGASHGPAFPVRAAASRSGSRPKRSSCCNRRSRQHELSPRRVAKGRPEC